MHIHESTICIFMNTCSVLAQRGSLLVDFINLSISFLFVSLYIYYRAHFSPVLKFVRHLALEHVFAVG